MKIRTRAFVVLWVITILVAGTVGFIIYALNVASEQDADRQRLAEIVNIHSSLWRSLVELKRDQHDVAVLSLPSIEQRLQAERSAINDYLAHQATLVRDPEQFERFRLLKEHYDKWSATWTSGVDRSEPADILVAMSERDFAPISSLLSDFDRRGRELASES